MTDPALAVEVGLPEGWVVHSFAAANAVAAAVLPPAALAPGAAVPQQQSDGLGFSITASRALISAAYDEVLVIMIV